MTPEEWATEVCSLVMTSMMDKPTIAEAIRRIIAEEREACAKLLDDLEYDCNGYCAKAIRART